MAKASEKFYNNTWFQIIVTTLILTPISSAIYDHTKDIPIITPILSVFKYVWVNVFNFNIPLYLVVIAFTILIVGMKNYLTFKDKIPEIYASLEVVKEPDYINYTEGKLKKWTWTWNWKYNSISDSYSISDLVPICNRCTYKMKGDIGFAIYTCPNCDNMYADYYELSSDIRNVILQKIERGDYPKD
ncbi:hypothetical protein ACVW0P_004497 [Mucilaginibacter sp. UYNi724]